MNVRLRRLTEHAAIVPGRSDRGEENFVKRGIVGWPFPFRSNPFSPLWSRPPHPGRLGRAGPTHSPQQYESVPMLAALSHFLLRFRVCNEFR